MFRNPRRKRRSAALERLEATLTLARNGAVKPGSAPEPLRYRPYIEADIIRMEAEVAVLRERIGV